MNDHQKPQLAASAQLVAAAMRGLAIAQMIYQFLATALVRVLDIATRFLPQTARLPVKILLCAFFIAFVLVVTRPETKTFEPRERSWPVEVQEIHYQTLAPIVQAYGEIVSAREIDLRALVSGEVISVAENFFEGSFVKKGETLLTIDPFNFENALAEAEAQLLGAEASYMTAKTDYERAEKLFAKGTVAKKYLDDRLADFLVKKGAYDRLKIVVRRARRDLQNTNVVAPFDAYIGPINVREGRLMNLNDIVASLSDAKNYEINFNLSDAEYGSLLNAHSQIVGQPVRAVWKIGDKDIVVTGKVRHVGALIDPTTRGVDVFANLEAQPDEILRGGAFVTVFLELAPLAHAVEVPLAALSGNEVYVVKQNRLIKRRVDVFLRSGQKAYLTAGLEENDRLLLTRFNEVSEGLLVEVK